MDSKTGTVSLDSLELDLQQYWLIIKRRRFPAFGIFCVVIVLTLLSVSRDKPAYRAEGKLGLRLVDRTALLTGLGSEDRSGQGELTPLTLQSNPLKTESEVLLSSPLLEQTIAQLKLVDPAGKPLKPSALRNQLKVSGIPGADVLKLSYESEDAEATADVVNQLMRAYIDNNILNNRDKAAAARKFIAEQLPKAEETVSQTDLELRNFKEQNGVINLEAEAKELVSATATLESSIAKEQSELADASSRLSLLRDKVGVDSDTAILLSSLGESPGVQQALKEFQEAQNQLAVERSRYEDQYPTVANLKQKEATLKALLQERVGEVIGSTNTVTDGQLELGETKQKLIQQFVDTEVQRLGLASRVARLLSARELYRRRASTFPKLEQTERELQRRLEVAQATYGNLLKKLQEVQIAEQQNTGNARIIEAAAVPDAPLSTKRFMKLVLGGLLASVAAILTIIVLETRDRSVKTVKEARKLFSYVWLGSIPQFGKITSRSSKLSDQSIPDLPVRDFPRSPTSAAYRLLQANLKFLNVEKGIKTIVVSSCVPKEGKSTISANLAATIAQLGRRVLLIDADLHHPQQHHIWNLTNAVGLTDLIVKQLDFSVAVNPVMDGLDVLTAGVIPPSPLAILDSKPFRALVASVSQEYDFIIFDSPPIMAEAESLTLGKMTDGILLVVRLHVLDFASANTSRDLLQQSSQTVLGMVINCAASENEFNRSLYYDSNHSSLADSLIASRH